MWRADTAVFCMARHPLAGLGHRLREASWAADTAVSVVSRAGCSDSLASEHRLADLALAALLHAGRPTLVALGAGAAALGPGPSMPAAPSLTAAAPSATLFGAP